MPWSRVQAHPPSPPAGQTQRPPLELLEVAGCDGPPAAGPESSSWAGRALSPTFPLGGRGQRALRLSMMSGGARGRRRWGGAAGHPLCLVSSGSGLGGGCREGLGEAAPGGGRGAGAPPAAPSPPGPSCALPLFLQPLLPRRSMLRLSRLGGTVAWGPASSKW